MSEITDENLQKSAQKFRKLVSLYMENRDLILMGGYTSGQDPELDEAVALWPKLMGIYNRLKLKELILRQAKGPIDLIK